MSVRWVPGQTHEFTVTLEENAWIQFVVEQRGIDVIVKVFSPEGKVLGEFDSPNGNDGPEHVSFVATAAGIYRITVSPLDPARFNRRGGTKSSSLNMRQATEQEIKASQNLEVVKAKGIALLAELEDVIHTDQFAVYANQCSTPRCPTPVGTGSKACDKVF